MRKRIVPSALALKTGEDICCAMFGNNYAAKDIQRVARIIARHYEQMEVRLSDLNDDVNQYVAELDADCGNAERLFRRALATGVLKSHPRAIPATRETE